MPGEAAALEPQSTVTNDNFCSISLQLMTAILLFWRKYDDEGMGCAAHTIYTSVWPSKTEIT